MMSRPTRGVASSPHCTACGVPRCTASSSQTMTRSSLLYVSAALTLSFVSPPAIVEYPLPRPKAFPHDPAPGAPKLYPVPTRGARPYGLVAAPDGMIWMALFGTNQIGRIDPADGALKIFPLPASGARPRRLIVDATGIVWYSDYARGKLGRLDPATGQVRDYPCPGGDASQTYGIAVGTDGRIWYDESGTDEIVAFDPATERALTVKIPTPGSVVRNMAVEPTDRK